MKLSILIPTIHGRQEQFERLKKKLEQQISENALSEEVELVHLSDNGKHTIGSKRNTLIDMAAGDFIAFVDDDDDVSNDYVSLIYRAIIEHPDIDCVGMKGLVTFRDKRRRTFVHSIQYTDYFSKGGTYFRPPYHLNPIRRAIAAKYRFEDINHSEDVDWAMRMSRDRVLQKEYFIDTVIYLYHSKRHWLYQFLIDLSEPVRHALGLRLVNRLRIKRWFKTHSS